MSNIGSSRRLRLFMYIQKPASAAISSQPPKCAFSIVIVRQNTAAAAAAQNSTSSHAPPFSAILRGGRSRSYSSPSPNPPPRNLSSVPSCCAISCDTSAEQTRPQRALRGRLIIAQLEYFAAYIQLSGVEVYPLYMQLLSAYS